MILKMKLRFYGTKKNSQILLGLIFQKANQKMILFGF